MKAFFLCATILCIANVNCGLHFLEPSAGAALDRFLGRLDGGWDLEQWVNEAKVTFAWINANPGQFQSLVNAIPKSDIAPLWKFCKKSDGRVHMDILNLLVEHIYGLVTTEEFKDGVKDFVRPKWATFDEDGNGYNFDEFTNFITTLAAIEARLYIKAYNENDDFMLNGYEIINWYNSQVAGWKQLYGIDNEVIFAAMNNAYDNAHFDGDELTMNMLDLTKFILNEWAIRLRFYRQIYA